MVKKIFSNNRLLLFLILFFLAWILFLDDYNLFRRLEARKEIRTLEAKKAYYQNEIKADSLLLESLTRNPDSLERLARERYMMKKDHEEIFIVVKESPED